MAVVTVRAIWVWRCWCGWVSKPIDIDCPECIEHCRTQAAHHGLGCRNPWSRPTWETLQTVAIFDVRLEPLEHQIRTRWTGGTILMK